MYQGTIPTKILGTKQISNAQGLPLDMLGTGIKGEKTNDETTGVIVLFIRLVIPNTSPSTDPILGPIIIDPTITGICIIVAFIKPRLINPMGVAESSTIIALNIDKITSSFVFIETEFVALNNYSPSLF